jgi:hypothetical protein
MISEPRPPDLLLLPVPAASPVGPDANATAVDLARSLTVSAPWNEVQPASIGVRREPSGLIGIVGRFDDLAMERFGALRWQVEHVWPHLHHVGYAEAEVATERLADALLARFGRATLSEFRFTAIPRGGFIVLGMLAYALGLTSDQVDIDGDPETVLVVVDDCAISGDRFRRYLEAMASARRVVFAPLYAPAALRTAICMQEANRVVACVSAHDLIDRAPERQGDAYDAWLARWQSRRPGGAYWIGQPDPISFAWNEPDLGYWNPVTERREKGWTLVPPEHCLKHRGRAHATAAVQVMDGWNGDLRPADGVMAVTFEGRVYVGSCASPAPLVLEDVAADLWRALQVHGQRSTAASAVAASYDVDPTAVRGDLDRFVAQLIERGVLARRP